MLPACETANLQRKRQLYDTRGRTYGDKPSRAVRGAFRAVRLSFAAPGPYLPRLPLTSLTGTTLAARYTIQRELGAGGMATCTSPMTRNTIARSRSRCCAPSSPRSSAPTGSWPRSGRPRTCSIRTSWRCIDSGRVDGTVYYVMPFVEGESLRDRLDAREAAPGRRRGADRARGGRRARLRAPPRRHPSRHQAREHPAPRWPGAGRGLRHRTRRLTRERHAHDRDRNEPRHADVHEPRAGHGRAEPGCAHGRLRVRLRVVRDAGRRAAVHRADGAGDRRQGADRPAAPALRPAAERAAACRGSRRARAGEAAGGPPRERPRVCRRPGRSGQDIGPASHRHPTARLYRQAPAGPRIDGSRGHAGGWPCCGSRNTSPRCQPLRVSGSVSSCRRTRGSPSTRSRARTWRSRPTGGRSYSPPKDRTERGDSISAA